MTGIAFLLCALLYLAVAGYAALRLRLSRDAVALGGVGLATAAWAATAALAPGGQAGALAAIPELLRLVAWLAWLLHLFDRTLGRGAQGRVLFLALCALALVAAAGAVVPGWAALDASGPELSTPAVLVRIALCLGGLLLVENLFRNVEPEERWHVNLPCIGIGALLVYDVMLVSDAALFRRLSPALLEGRPVVTALVAPLLVLSAWRDRRLRGGSRVSRRAVLHTASLMLSGIFLVGLAAAGEVFRRLGADWGVVAELSLIFGGLLVLATLLTSGSARGWLRYLLVDALHTQRFDYGREWARCIDTLSDSGGAGSAGSGMGGAGQVPLHERVLRAVCGIVDSPGGVLFLREAGEAAAEEAMLPWAGSWNQPAGAGLRPGTALLRALEGNEVLQVPGAPDAEGWPAGLPEAWLAVPLRHGELLLGAVLAARPRAAFRMDAEVAALLRIVGREGAAFLAEQRAAQALIQTRELRERAERFAFVAHDIKNLSSQLSLLVSNAERHMDNPEFRRDMLDTIRASVGKVGTTLARLQGPALPERGAAPGAPALRTASSGAAPFSPGARLAELLAERARVSAEPVTLDVDAMDGETGMAVAGFDAAVGHLLDNALEASGRGEAVRVSLRHEGGRAMVEIADRGCGMTPEFVRDRLFRPLASSKPHGHGIGAFQARSLLREAGGDLGVESAPGRGTTMRLVMPLLGECRPVAAPAGAQATSPALPAGVEA